MKPSNTYRCRCMCACTNFVLVSFVNLSSELKYSTVARLGLRDAKWRASPSPLGNCTYLYHWRLLCCRWVLKIWELIWDRLGGVGAQKGNASNLGGKKPGGTWRWEGCGGTVCSHLKRGPWEWERIWKILDLLNPVGDSRCTVSCSTLYDSWGSDPLG